MWYCFMYEGVSEGDSWVELNSFEIVNAASRLCDERSYKEPVEFPHGEIDYSETILVAGIYDVRYSSTRAGQ